MQLLLRLTGHTEQVFWLIHHSTWWKFYAIRTQTSRVSPPGTSFPQLLLPAQAVSGLESKKNA